MKGDDDGVPWVEPSTGFASGSKTSSGQLAILLVDLTKPCGDNSRWASLMCFWSCTWFSWNDFLSLRNWIIVLGTYSRFIAFLEDRFFDRVALSMPLLVNRALSTFSSCFGESGDFSRGSWFSGAG